MNSSVALNTQRLSGANGVSISYPMPLLAFRANALAFRELQALPSVLQQQRYMGHPQLRVIAASRSRLALGKAATAIEAVIIGKPSLGSRWRTPWRAAEHVPPIRSTSTT